MERAVLTTRGILLSFGGKHREHAVSSEFKSSAGDRRIRSADCRDVEDKQGCKRSDVRKFQIMKVFVDKRS